jgi:hypothetical protein
VPPTFPDAKELLTRAQSSSTVGSPDFDFSTPEGEVAMRAAVQLVLEVARPLARRVALYERSLGLLVIPVLIRRVIINRVLPHLVRRR